MRIAIAVFCLTGLLLAGSGVFVAAHAQSATATMPASPSGANETQGAGGGLGSSHRFATVDAATQHCPSDKVVWSRGKKLKYVLPGSAHYGKGKGFYACKMEADSAGFHQRSP